ncbi:hypothetical protein SAY86_031675 [Trapa natans]|uniref:Uncharacterized protein n=1 Tax=Trapa natans TaxID=22666 RepID=A0AAN7LSC4_TRANT|nr:hypothetical protein SAY86_031675 [Trapa natans]
MIKNNLIYLILLLIFLGVIVLKGSWHIISHLLLSVLLCLFPPLTHFWLVPGGLAWRNHRNTSGPLKLKGPCGWPILGSIPSMGPLAHRKLAALAASLGAKPAMALSLGLTPVIISSDPETAKEILCSPSFSDRPVKESARSLMFERAIGFAPSGVYWRHLRRIAANHMFSPRRIGGLGRLRARIADQMMEEVKKEHEGHGFVKLRRILQKGSLSIMLESVFGDMALELLDRREEMEDMVKEGYELIATFNWEDHFPLRLLDFFGVKRRCHELAAKVRRLVGKVVEDRKRTRSEGLGFINGNDFLSSLLSLPDEDQLNESDMVAVLWEMIFRGTDTVAILLEWIMARVVLHPDVQAKAQQEIDISVGGGRSVQDSDIASLPYLQHVVKEALRLHPPGPLLSWARLSVRDVHVGKLLIPAGTTAMVNMWAITHDPSVWKDPWAFNPDRFLEEDVLVMGTDTRLAPFGAGRRVCPGRAMGLATVHLWLARLLQRFRWLPVQAVDLSECLKLSLEMKKPLTCDAISR